MTEQVLLGRHRSVTGLGPQGRNVAVVGLGYVGLPTALSLADHGARIIGYDVSEARLADIKSGRVDLLGRDHQRLAHHLRADSLRLTTEPYALAEADAIVVCVPTPIDAHQSPDLRALSGACAAVVEHAVAGQTIVVTSTTYVGCTRELVANPLRDKGLEIGKDVFVAFSPERIDPGVEAHAPDRTPRVVGGVTAECTARAIEVLAHTASATGVGGHCIPCDPHYLLWQLRARRFDSPVTRTAMTAIALRPRDLVSQARAMLADSGRATRGARVLVVGVTYKPGVADIRESPALEIIDELAAAGAAVAFADPLIESLETRHAGQLVSHQNPGDDAWDLVLIHTRHAGVDHGWLAMHPTVLDTRYRS